MADQTRAYLYAAAAVLLWSTVASAFKISLRYLEPVQLLCFANVASVLTLFAVLVVRRRLSALTGVGRVGLLRYGVLGILNPFLYYLVLFEAYDRLPAQEAQPLNYTWAITLSLLSIPLLKQRISATQFIAIGVSYLGVLVISTQGDVLSLHFSNATGVALALLSTVIWSVYWIYNTKDKQDPVAGLFFTFLFAVPFTLTAAAILTGFRVQNWAGLLGAAYVGLFEMGIAFVLWLKALRLSESTAQVANLIFFSPFLSLVFIHYLVGEAILASTFVGLVFIVAGNVLQQFGRVRTVPSDRGR